MKFSLADSRVNMWSFSDVSGDNSVPIFRVCWWFGRTKTVDSVTTYSSVLVLPNHHHTLQFGSTKPPAHPEDGDGVSYRNVGKPSHLDATVCPRKFHCILSPRKLQDLYQSILTLNLLTTTIVAPPSNASKWQMGFNSAFKGLITNVTIPLKPIYW